MTHEMLDEMPRKMPQKMPRKMTILGVSGSLRQRSFNTMLLEAGGAFIEAPAGFAVHDLANLPVYNEDLDGEDKPAPVIAWLRAVASADAILFATPEFNHSISGALKNAIDWASRPAFKSVLANKPAGILSASMSPVGGARAQMHLKDILASTLTPVYPVPDYLLPMAQNAFDGEGALTDATAARRLQRYVTGLLAWAAKNS